MMGGPKYLVTALAALYVGWDLYMVDWNPIAYIRDVPAADHRDAGILALLALLAWLIDRWTREHDWHPRRPSLPVLAGCLIVVILAAENVALLNGNLLAIVDLPSRGPFWLMLIAVIGTCWLHGQQSAPPTGAITHGSAGWAGRNDITPLVGARQKSSVEGTFLLGQDGRKRRIILPPRLVKQHTLTIGPTGSGKTRRLYMPNAARAAFPFVATDPKGELWEYTSGYQDKAWRLAPRRADSTHGFNWIPLCKDDHLAELLAAAVMQTDEDTREEQFWKLADQELCTALFVHVAHAPTPTPATLHALLQLGSRQLVEHLKQSPVARARACALDLADLKAETRAGITMSVSHKLAFLQDPAVRRFTSSELRPPDFRPLTDPTSQLAIYWQVHEQDAELLKPLSSLFFTLLLYQLCNSEREIATPVVLLLDEFAQVGRIPKFPSTIAVARGRGVALALGIQSLAQLEQLYGRAGAEIIRTNCGTKIVLPGLDYDTAEHVSRALGETTISQEYQNRKPESLLVTSYSYGEHHTQRRLLTADEVRRIGDNEVLLIIANYRPIRARSTFWSEPPNPAPSGWLGPEQTTVVCEPVRPRTESELHRQLQNLEEE